jgi:hypothetical protein
VWLNGWHTRPPNSDPRYSTRKASIGEIKLIRNAGNTDAGIADNPRARTATDVTTGLYGSFRPESDLSHLNLVDERGFEPPSSSLRTGNH